MKSLFSLLALFSLLQFSYGEIVNLEKNQHATVDINSKFTDEAAPKQYNIESNNHINKWSGYNYKVLINLFAIMASMLYLIIISQIGCFKKHHYEFGKFLKQGFVAFIAFLIFYGTQNLLTSLVLLKSGFPGPLPATFVIIMILIIGLLGLVSITFIYFIERFILKGKENILLEVVVPFFTTMIIPIIFPIIILVPGMSNSTSLNEFQDQISVTITVVVSFTALIATARAFYIYLNKKSENIIRVKDVELARINEMHKQAELQSLQAKINPHFLYNSLNSIASLANSDAKKTEQMALSLSDFFKYSINREQQQFTSLAEELNAVSTYLDIEKVRFGNKLNFEIDCPDELKAFQIPRLLIQPLVENAVKHGVSQITDDGLIRIVVRKDENQLKIRIYDNGPAFPEGPLSGYGIQNTQERLNLLYKDKASLNWQNGKGKYIEISLPFE